MSDAALLGAYCASFWQSIVDDYEAVIQGLPSSPPQGLQDGITEARRELKRALDYKVGAMTQHIAVPDLVELLVAENQAGDDYEACAQITQRSIQRLLSSPPACRRPSVHETVVRLCRRRHRGRSFLGAPKPVSELDPGTLSTLDYATGRQCPWSLFMRVHR